MAFGNDHNLGSILEPIVSVEAWRTICNADEMGAVHVDATFLEAFLGDEVESKVRFQAALKRAVIKVYVSQRDPIKVVRNTVDRGLIVESDYEGSEKGSVNFEARGAIKAGVGVVPLKGSGTLDAGVKKVRDETIKTKKKIRDHDIQQYTQGPYYCWEVVPRADGVLKGKIWDAINEPRLQTLLTSASAKSSDCEVRVIIECRRQDISIRNVQLKEKRLSLPAFRESHNNMVAAEAVIKKLISEKGFSIENFEEPFNSLVVTSVIVPEG